VLANQALRQTGLPVASPPLAPAAEHRYLAQTDSSDAWHDALQRRIFCHLYLEKLGFDYPRGTENQLLRQDASSETGEKRNVLFICSKNQWRSPTAEAVWRKHPALSVRSAGTSSTARRKVSIDDIRWADVIFVMEEKHRSRLIAEFTMTVERKPIHVLDIPDEYKYMDPELVAQLQEAVAALLGLR
jgi:predicted protein tyrosine phosphatase